MLRRQSLSLSDTLAHAIADMSSTLKKDHANEKGLLGAASADVAGGALNATEFAAKPTRMHVLWHRFMSLAAEPTKTLELAATDDAQRSGLTRPAPKRATAASEEKKDSRTEKQLSKLLSETKSVRTELLPLSTRRETTPLATKLSPTKSTESVTQA